VADVLVTHSYHLPYDPKQLRKMQPYLPLATLYAATALRQNGISVAAFDVMLQEPAGFSRALAQHRPRIVAVYEDDFNFLSKMCLTRMREVAWQMAKEARAMGAVVIAHGSDSTDNPLLFLENGFDYVCCGESEETMVQLCNSILEGNETPEIDGLVRLDARGVMIRSHERLAKNPYWPDLAIAARDLVDLEPYRRAWVDAHGYFSINMVSSRGCPYRCNWCAKPIYGDSFSVRSAALVAAEMRQLKYEFGADHLWFADDIFGLRPKWLRELATAVENLDAAIPFKMQSRVDLMTPENVSALRRAGCAEVWMGAESGSQKILDAMDKGTRVDQIAEARENLRQEGIRACYFLQFGYPGETWQDIQKTIRLVRDTRPDDIGVSVSYPLPGTKFFERVQAQLGEKTNWSDSEDLSMMFQGAYTNEFYRALHDALHAQVDCWNSGASKNTAKEQKPHAELDDLWQRVIELEKSCRNPRPTMLAEFPDTNLVQLQAQPRATSFEDILNVLAG